MALDILAKIFGSVEGHKLNTEVDNTLTGIANSNPVTAAILADVVPHPAGATATTVVTAPDGSQTYSEAIAVGGKILVALDPAFITQVDALINGLLAKFGTFGLMSEQFIDGYINGRLEGMSFNAPVAVTTTPVAPKTMEQIAAGIGQAE